MAARRLTTAGFSAIFVLVATAQAAAQTADKMTAAEQLFVDARQSMNAGRFADACAKLEQSQAIDPSVGALGWLARCYEKLGRTASAWATYRSASLLAGQRGDVARKALADERSSALEPELVRLQLDASAVAQLAGVSIERNGTPVARALWDMPFAVDPGEHRFEIRAPGYGSLSLTVSVTKPGSVETIRIQELVRAPDLSETEAPQRNPIASGQPTVASRTLPPASPGGGTRHVANRGVPVQGIIGLAAGGLGVAALAVGTIFLMERNSKLAARDSSCPEAPAGACPSEASRLQYEANQTEAQGAATISSVSFVAGAALVAGGVVLWLTAPRSVYTTEFRAPSAAIHPMLDRRGGGVWLSTTW